MTTPRIRERLRILAETRRPIADAQDPRCTGCAALCCHDLAWPIDRPRTEQEVAALSWKLQFTGTQVVIKDSNWLLRIEGRCMYLGEDSRCTIYATRPQPCRDHNPPYCERYVRPDDVEIDTPEELVAYLESAR